MAVENRGTGMNLGSKKKAPKKVRKASFYGGKWNKGSGKGK